MDNLQKAITYLEEYNKVSVPDRYSKADKLRALMNITMPKDLEEDYYRSQDLALQELYKDREVSLDSLSFNKANIALYLGDITDLKVDAIVNAGNEQLLGCFIPLHSCVDNAIHSRAGLQPRRDLLQILEGRTVDVSEVILTKGYNLNASYIFHTVGPRITYEVKDIHIKQLCQCYKNALEEAKRLNLTSIAFPSISTGIYAFPIELASSIAISTVKDFIKDYPIKVIFDVFSKKDYQIYEQNISRN